MLIKKRVHEKRKNISDDINTLRAISKSTERDKNVFGKNN